MSFEVPPLAYELTALEPYIDATTMRINRDRHAVYVEKANRVVKGTVHENSTVEEILSNLDALTPEQEMFIRPNCGGHYNHVLLWQTMRPSGGGGPEGQLASAIDEAFGSIEELKSQLKQRADDRFASGWAWLVHGPDGLAATGNRNEDNPLSKGLTPLLGIDMWEHAYVITYQLDKSAYVDGFWNVIDWDRVAARYSAAVEAATSLA